MKPESIALYGGLVLTALTLLGAVIAWYLNGKAEDAKELAKAQKESRDKEIAELERALEAGMSSLRERNGILFSKLDEQVRELHTYKLHVAETYVNQAALKEIFAPFAQRLERIENHLDSHGGGVRV